MPVIRSISGLRATLGDSLTPSLVSDYAVAFSSTLPDGTIYIGRDGRPSGEWIEQSVVAALRACGRSVTVLGVVPTPTVQLMTEHSDAVGGIAITASHNPAPWNGMKFIGSDGVFLDAEQNARLWAILDSRSFVLSPNQQTGRVRYDSTAIDKHIERICSLPIFTEEAMTLIAGRKLTAVVDAVNCSASVAIPALLRTLGIEVHELYCDNTGLFPHTPEPLTENLTDLINSVRSINADIGIAIDPDADRLVLIGKGGVPIGEEKTVMLAIETVMRNKHLFTDAVIPRAVINLSTSRMADDAALRYGGECLRAPVGEINVVRAMQEAGAIIGGEGSGGVILPHCHYGRDSLVGVALVMWLMAHTTPEEWDDLTLLSPYIILKHKQPLAEGADLKTILERVSAMCSDADVIDTRDGIRCDWSDTWVQLRGSNTEPIVRIIAEAPTEQQAQELLERVKEVLN